MPTKTSEQMKAEVVSRYYGINTKTLTVESVVVSRGGTITVRPDVGKPRDYRIKRGRPALREIERVFGLTGLVRVSSDLEALEHPSVAVLRRQAAERRQERDAEAAEAEAGEEAEAS